MARNDLSTFCSLPTTRRVVAPSGLIRPCCDFSSPYTYAEADFKLLQRALLENERHAHCRICWEKDTLGVESLRSLKPLPSPASVRTLELNLSNICNLKCRMCGSDSSSSWGADDIFLRTETSVGAFRPKQIERLVRAFPGRHDLFQFLDSFDWSHLEVITFFGGEPFLQPQFLEALNFLVERGITGVEIRVTTNGIIWSDPLVSTLSKFDRVDYRLSIEGVGPLYKYIRGGEKFDLSDVERNLSRVKSSTEFNLSCNCAIGAYSAFGIADLFVWLDQNLCPLDGNLNWYDIFDPSYLASRALPLEVRNFAKIYNVEVLKRSNRLSPALEANLDLLLQLHLPTLAKDKAQFIEFTNSLDSRRGDSFFDLLPASIPLDIRKAILA